MTRSVIELPVSADDRRIAGLAAVAIGLTLAEAAIPSPVPGVKPGRVVCFGVPDETEGTELIAVVAEVASESPEEQAEIGKLIRTEVNRRTSLTVNVVDVLADRWIIKTSSGKTSRTANRQKWMDAKKADPGAPLRGSATP